jgi:RNA polymerase sigma-70 factor (ECF subfamily)
MPGPGFGEQLPGIVLTGFAVAMALPLVYGGSRSLVAAVRGLVLLMRRCWQARHPVRAAALLTDPPRPDLTPRMRRFAYMTRELIASLEYASQRSAGWRDEAPASLLRRLCALGRDEEFRPTIGVTGEVWAWLSSAEDLAESSELHADDVAAVAAAVRGVLFREGPVGARLAEIVEYLVRADTDLRAAGSSPYRGRVPVRPPTQPSASRKESTTETREAIERAHDEVLETHHPAIVGVARQYARDEASLEDLVQEIRLSVWKALGRFRGESSIKTYVLRIAHYRGVSFARRQRPHAPVEDRADPSPGPGELLDDARRRLAVAEAIESLPPTQREAIVLLLQGLSYREIGERLGISGGTTSARITRARQALRRRLAQG